MDLSENKEPPNSNGLCFMLTTSIKVSFRQTQTWPANKKPGESEHRLRVGEDQLWLPQRKTPGVAPTLPEDPTF